MLAHSKDTAPVAGKRMLITDDGLFRATSSKISWEEGFPTIAGVIDVPLTVDQRAAFESTLLAQSSSRSLRYRPFLLGRSGHAQVGLIVRESPHGVAELKGRLLRQPISVSAVGKLQEPWLESILQLSSKRERFRIGRMLLMDWSSRLEKEKVARLFASKYLACDANFHINDDGSISIDIEHTEFIDDTAALAEATVRRDILLHSRSALLRFQDIRKHGSPVLLPGSLTVMGIRFSSGPFPAVIRPTISKQLVHLQSGIFLDAFRSTRIGREYGASGLRQIEIFNHSNRPYRKGPGFHVTVDIFPTPTGPSHLLAEFADPSRRTFCHIHGVPFANVVQVGKTSVRTALFSNIDSVADRATCYAKVVTRHGVTNVGWAATPKFQRRTTEESILNRAGHREKRPSAVMSIARNLSFTVDQGRALIVDRLPNADELFSLRDLGVKAFVFHGTQTSVSSVAGPAGAIYMTGHLHETVHSLSKQGISFVLASEPHKSLRSPKRDSIREFFNGFWCLSEAKYRIDELQVLVNVYGSHKDQVAKESRRGMTKLLRQLARSVPRNSLAVMHGKGGGFMGLADEVARQLGIISIGVGLDVEKVGQTTNLLPELALDFQTSERAYRQKLMDHLGLFKIFNIGGYGTLEEATITICSSKLLENIPAPILFVDEGSRHAVDGTCRNVNMWRHLHDQTRTIPSIRGINYINGRSVNFASSSLGQPWVANLIHCVSSYDEAAKILVNFISAPVAYWESARIPEKELRQCWSNYSRRVESYGFRIPEFLKRAIEIL